MAMAEKKGNRFFIWVIMILLFIGLLGFGTGGLSGTIRNIGTVGDRPVTVVAYQNELNQQIRAFSAQTQTPISFPQAVSLGLDAFALSQIVGQRALDNEAANLGISVGDARVREEVLGIPGFQGLDGQFDREAYRFSLQRSGMSEAEFETGIREEIARTLLQGAVVGGIPAPQVYADTLVQYIAERRDVTWATVTAAALTTPQPGPTDADLTAYYTANPDQFTLPEVRNISYVWLTPEMIADDVVVDDTATREIYDERIAEFMQPERRLVERLPFPDLEAANAALAAITEGTSDFDTAVTSRGLDLSDVDLGDVALSDLAADAGAAIFAAAPGDVVGPFETSLGPALYRMNAVLSAEEITYEEALPDLRAELAAARARRIIEDTVDTINDLLIGGAQLEDVAERTALEIGSIAWGPDTRDDIAAYDEFRVAAAAAELGSFPELLTLEDGGIFAMRLDDIIPPSLQPQADVTDALTVAWTAAQTRAAVLAYAQDLATQIQPLTGFDTLGLVENNDDALSRRSFIEGTPPGFIARVYEMSPGEVTVIESGDNAIILRLDVITPPDDADPDTAATRESVANTAASGLAQDIFEVFAAQVQQRTDVAIDQAAVNAVHANFQ